MSVATDLARLFVGVTLLAFASYTDYRWRRAPNVLWLVMLAAGAFLLAVDAVVDFASVRAAWPYLVAAPVFAGVVYLMYQFNLIAGGADAKALMALALLAPFPLALTESLPLVRSPMPASVVVLENALLAALAVPVVMFVANAARGHVAFPFAFLGYRKPVADLDRGHAWPMEWVDDEGNVRRALFVAHRGLDLADQKEKLRAKGVERVWVTPKVPFMIPLLVGIVLAFTVGDLLSSAMGAVLGP